MGATGSGKTHFGMWLFAHSPFKAMPFVIIDYKGDDIIASIDRAREISVNELPSKAGLYIMRPEADDPEIERWLGRVKEKGRIGLFVDEGYMIPHQAPKYKNLNRILTQGRSLRIPVTILTQRPAWCSRFIRSEASYYAIFRLQDKADYKTVQGFVPQDDVFDFDYKVPEYHCRWYDVSKDFSCILKPSPGVDRILELYDDKLKKKVTYY